MMIVADLEVHSRYARACSKELSPRSLDFWARRKGVQLLSSGDITHPLWRREMQRKLIEKESGFYVLKDEAASQGWDDIKTDRIQPRFVLGGEVSLMFRQGEIKGRRVHLLFLAPSFEVVERLIAKINDKGKLASDGRPILSMSCHDFAEACFATDESIMVIPAHIWTPWFGLLGSKSGFDSIEEAFGELAPRILAYETGLSADPPMCWRVESLIKRVLISSSDLHSGPNMMREALLLKGRIESYSYERLARILKTLGHPDYYGTLEFYPQEGKYHADGHAACKIVLEPEKTNELNGLCPVCGRPITVGVNHRVLDLATYPAGYKPKTAGEVVYSIPLQEIIADVLSKGKATKGVQALYARMVDTINTEYALLHEVAHFPEWVPPRVVEGIYQVRRGEVIIRPGYDGLYGTVHLASNGTVQPALWA